jgi:aspartyl/asparaginyl-tRNA synthetase
MNQSTSRSNIKRSKIADIHANVVGRTLVVQARIHSSRVAGIFFYFMADRMIGSKLSFLILRQGTQTVQAILAVDEQNISKQMLKFATSIPTESLIEVEAQVFAPHEPIKSCSVTDAELHIQKVTDSLISDFCGRFM